jgi:hypothetical protein
MKTKAFQRTAQIVVAADLATTYGIARRQSAKLVEEGQKLHGAEIKVNGSTTYLAYGANDFELA